MKLQQARSTNVANHKAHTRACAHAHATLVQVQNATYTVRGVTEQHSYWFVTKLQHGRYHLLIRLQQWGQFLSALQNVLHDVLQAVGWGVELEPSTVSPHSKRGIGCYICIVTKRSIMLAIHAVDRHRRLECLCVHAQTSIISQLVQRQTRRTHNKKGYHMVRAWLVACFAISQTLKEARAAGGREEGRKEGGGEGWRKERRGGGSYLTLSGSLLQNRQETLAVLAPRGHVRYHSKRGRRHNREIRCYKWRHSRANKTQPPLPVWIGFHPGDNSLDEQRQITDGKLSSVMDGLLVLSAMSQHGERKQRGAARYAYHARARTCETQGLLETPTRRVFPSTLPPCLQKA